MRVAITNGGIANFKSFSLPKYIIKKIRRGPKSATNLIISLYITLENVNTCGVEGVFFLLIFFLNIHILIKSNGRK